jgi:hypothetical protein
MKRSPLSAGLGLATGVAMLALCEARPEEFSDQAVFTPDAVNPNHEVIEITLLKPEFRNILIIQMPKLGSDEPDEFSIHVPDPSDPELKTGLFCYISLLHGDSYKQAYFNNDIGTPEVPISGEARNLMAEFARAVEATTKDLKVKDIGYGVIRTFPKSAYAALDRVLSAPGGCNKEVVPSD